MTALPLDTELIKILVSASDEDLKRAERLITDTYDELDPEVAYDAICLFRLVRDVKCQARKNTHQMMRIVAFLAEALSPVDTPPEP